MEDDSSTICSVKCFSREIKCFVKLCNLHKEAEPPKIKKEKEGVGLGDTETRTDTGKEKENKRKQSHYKANQHQRKIRGEREVENNCNDSRSGYP